MTASKYFIYLQKEIHTVVAATTDDERRPVTCAIDIMDADEDGLYFLTAKGKGFYNRLKKDGYMALTGMKGEDTLSCVAMSVRGRVCELGEAQLPRLFEKNPYMNEIYPTEKSRRALTVFKLYDGSGDRKSVIYLWKGRRKRRRLFHHRELYRLPHLRIGLSAGLY